MAKHELLSVQVHEDLHIIDRFRRDSDTEAFQSLALLGFSKGENLFFDWDGWRASYVPGFLACGPFLISFHEKDSRVVQE